MTQFHLRSGIRSLISQDPSLTRAALSRKLCVLWQWLKPNGELKDMTCRVALSHMQADNLIVLPPSRLPVGRRRPHFPATPASDPQSPITQPVYELGALSLRLVQGTAQSRLWNEYVARYHYLGYTPMSGAQLRYNVFADEQLVACIGFGASAWKLKDRERFIGWSEEQRARHLQLVVNIDPVANKATNFIKRAFDGLRMWSVISSPFDSSDFGALHRYKSLMWHGHTARFAPGIAFLTLTAKWGTYY